MSKRNYNVFFNTHTVSGIVISIALYVIFFAGAFALFKEEIYHWEKGKTGKNISIENVNFDNTIKELSKDFHYTSRDLRFYLTDTNNELYLLTTPAKDTVGIPTEAKYRNYYTIDTKSLKRNTYIEQYSYGEFLYRLHFFAQLPYGTYLSGLIAFFFLFAIITGVIVHWRKIVSNFYQFNPKTSLKRIWTDAHTSLGIIGLPFQFIYALTGTYFCLGILVLIPANFLYNGNQQKLTEELRIDQKQYEWKTETNKELPSINDFIKKNIHRWDSFKATDLCIKNYKGVNTKYILMGELHESERFLSTAFIVYDFETNTTSVIKNPTKINYNEDIQQSLERLHFGSFAGKTSKIIYFILALITCFVIISGVLIWVEARNKKSMTLKQRLYTAKVGHIYMAICLSLFPVIALFFIVIKLLPDAYQTQKMSILYNWFFSIWLLLSIFLRYKRNNYFTNKFTLLSGAILGFLIPIVNGIKSNNWIWNTYDNKQYDILTIDILWLILAGIALLSYFKITKKIQEQSTFTKNPIDYKNIKKLLKEEKINQLKTTNQKAKKTASKNQFTMRTKIIILWIFLAVCWIIHHIYGLFNIYYNETLMMDGATGEAPLIHHLYRMAFEGMCMLFALLTIEISKKWFRVTSIVWAGMAALYNLYHIIEAVRYEAGNISEIFMLFIAAIASIILVKNIFLWIKEN